MNAADFDAVTYDGAVYCVGCLPGESGMPGVSPIFADSEWDSYPVCNSCRYEHDYVSLTAEGRIARREREWSPSMRRFSARLREEGVSEAERELPSFAWPGGYTVIYIDKEGGTYCGKCANSTDLQLSLSGYGTYDEGPDMQCDECSDTIESSYGDPDAEDAPAE